VHFPDGPRLAQRLQIVGRKARVVRMAMGNDYTVVRSVNNLPWSEDCSFTPLEGFDDVAVDRTIGCFPPALSQGRDIFSECRSCNWRVAMEMRFNAVGQ
jgi:hypothetical protein